MPEAKQEKICCSKLRHCLRSAFPGTLSAPAHRKATLDQTIPNHFGASISPPWKHGVLHASCAWSLQVLRSKQGPTHRMKHQRWRGQLKKSWSDVHCWLKNFPGKKVHLPNQIQVGGISHCLWNKRNQGLLKAKQRRNLLSKVSREMKKLFLFKSSWI